MADNRTQAENAPLLRQSALSRIRVRIDEELAAAWEPGWGAPAALFIVNAVFAAGIYRLVAG